MEVYGEEPPRRRAGRRWTALVASVVALAFLATISILPGGGSPRDSVSIGGDGDFGGALPAPPATASGAGATAVKAPVGAGAPAPAGSAGDASLAAGSPSTPGPSSNSPAVAANSALPAATPTDLTPGCGPADCITVDATAPGGAFSHSGNGLTEGVQPNDSGDAAAMAALGVSDYRGAPGIGFLDRLYWQDWDAAAPYAKTTTLVLSNIWQEQYGYPYPPTPWSNWSNYKTWLAQTVRNVMASGRRVTYWEIFNEPGWHGYYSQKDFNSMTPAELLQQFLVSYRVIKSIDPAAKIIGPSTGVWSLTPIAPSAGNHEFDLGTFLRFAAANNLKLAAIAWHENGATPSRIDTEAAATEALIRSLPALGNPPMILQEFAAESTQPIPGWDVAYLAAIAQSGFISADRSCWQNGCQDGEMDGILAPDGVTRTAEYWERLAYARMSGRTLTVASNDPTVSGLASVDSGQHKVSVLLGRDAGCAAQTWCDAEFPAGQKPAPAVPVVVRIHVPWSSPATSVQLSRQPYQIGVVPTAPAALPVENVSTTPATGGGEWVSFPIPAYGDGDAYALTISG